MSNVRTTGREPDHLMNEALTRLKQLRETLHAIAEYGPVLPPAAVASIAALAVQVADATIEAIELAS